MEHFSGEIKHNVQKPIQKISISPQGRELEILKGLGVKDPGNSGGAGVGLLIVSRCPLIQCRCIYLHVAVQKSFLTY